MDVFEEILEAAEIAATDRAGAIGARGIGPGAWDVEEEAWECDRSVGTATATATAGAADDDDNDVVVVALLNLPNFESQSSWCVPEKVRFEYLRFIECSVSGWPR